MGVLRAMLLAFIQVEQEVLSYTGRPPSQDGCGTHTSSNPASRQTSKMYVRGKQSTSCECPLTLDLPPFYVPKLFGIRILPESFDFLKWFVCCLPFTKLWGVYSQILYNPNALLTEQTHFPAHACASLVISFIPQCKTLQKAEHTAVHHYATTKKA